LSVEPHNEALIAKWNWCQDKLITVTSTIGQGKMFNTFLRVNEHYLQLMAGNTDPVEVLHTLREMKNNF
jgi:hydroxyacylglutathione hydrolase